MTNVMTAQNSNAAINAKIKAISKTGMAFNVLVQETMEAIVSHARDFGDCTAAARMVLAIPTTIRRAEIINHFGDYSPIRVVKNAKDNTFKASFRKPEDAKGNKDDLYRDFDIEGLHANPWYERKALEKEPGMLTFADINEEVSKLADKFNRMLTKNIREAVNDQDAIPKISLKDQDNVKSLVAHLRALSAQAKAGKLIPVMGTTIDDTTYEAPTDEPAEKQVVNG